MVRIEVPVDASWGRANARAAAMAKAGLRPRRTGGQPGRGAYAVPSGSAAGSVYTTRVLDAARLEAACSCEHGRSGKAGHCWHAAAALGAELALLSRAQDAAERDWQLQARAAKMARFARS